MTTTMALAATLVVGAIAASRMPLEFLPDISGPVLWVQIPHLNSTPQEIEQRIAIPAEGQLRTVKNLAKIESYISSDYANLKLVFDWKTDMDYGYLEVRERLDRLLPTFPDDVERYLVWRFSASDLEILWMDVGWAGATPSELWEFVDRRLRPALERIDGVAQATIWGGKADRINVDLDQDRLKKHGLNAYDLIVGVERDHVNRIAGNVTSQGTRYVVRALSRYEDLEALRNLVVAPSGLRLADVAEVSFGPPPREMITRVDGRETLAVGVKKESRANTVEVCRRVRAALEEVRAENPKPGLAFSVGFDQSEYIVESFENLASAGRIGAVFAVLVLFLFLRNWRATAVIALSIPFSVLIAVAVLYFAGKTLNVLSMMGLMLAIGMVVDDSIVVVENVMTERERGLSPDRAASEGASKVALAVTASTLTTVVVFLPLIFLDRGEMRVYMEDSGAAINLSLLASLAIALTFIPLVASRILRTGNIRRSPAIERLGAAYGRLLAACLRNRLAVMAALALALAATWAGPVKSLGARAQAEDDDRAIKIGLDVQGDYNLDKVEEYFLAFEKILEAHREELDVEHLYVQSRSNEGAIHLFLEKDHRPTEKLKERVRELIPEFRGGRFRIVQDDWSSRPETTTLSLRITGEDPDVLREYALLLASRLDGVEGIREVNLETGRGKEEMRIVVDRALAAVQGVSPAAAAQTIAFAFRGRELPKIQEREREVDVFIRLREEDRRSAQDLRRMSVLNLAGMPVPLGAVARFEEAPGYHSIDRSRGKRFLKIVLESDKETITKVRERVSAILDGFYLPPGYQVSYGDAFVTLHENQAAFKEAMGMSLVLIYLLLGAMFESFLLPITVLASVPLAFMGSYWLMYALGTPMDYAAYIGLIILVGIVVKNAIVIVDRIGGRRAEGMEGDAAIVAASVDRFRPVLMTALTTILGLVPLAFGSDAVGSLQFYPMGRVVMGGMVSSTVLTLFVIPVTYSLTAELGAALRSALPRFGAGAAEETHYYT